MTRDEMLALLYWSVAYWREAVDRLCGGAGAPCGDFAASYAMVMGQLLAAEHALADFVALAPAGDQVAICQQ